MFSLYVHKHFIAIITGLEQRKPVESMAMKEADGGESFVLLKLQERLDLSPATRPLCLPVPVIDESSRFSCRSFFFITDCVKYFSVS